MTARHFLVPCFLAACIFLGGATLAGYAANLFLQLIALLILVAAFMARPHNVSGPAVVLQWMAGAVVASAAIQLIPLPPEIWTLFPGRVSIAQGFELRGEPLPWLSISLSPLATLASALWLLPAMAIVFSMIRLGAFRPVIIAWVIVAATMGSVLIGGLQVAGNSLYFYQVTNRGFAVGPFANANHMATLLLVSIPFLFALIGRARNRSRSRSGSGLVVAYSAMLAVVAVGLAINTSLAGLGLAIPVVATSLLLLRRAPRLPIWALPLIGLLSSAAIALVFLLPIGNNLLGDAATGSESRATSISKTLEAAVAHFPLGSGYGTFPATYRTFEDPGLVTSTWMNHAHSDYAELLLEGGLLSALLFVAFLIWWGSRIIMIWRTDAPDPFARAASIASAAILLHSLVDYPLRTAGISALMAACLVLLTMTREAAVQRRDQNRELRHLAA